MKQDQLSRASRLSAALATTNIIYALLFIAASVFLICFFVNESTKQYFLANTSFTTLSNVVLTMMIITMLIPLIILIVLLLTSAINIIKARKTGRLPMMKDTTKPLIAYACLLAIEFWCLFSVATAIFGTALSPQNLNELIQVLLPLLFALILILAPLILTLMTRKALTNVFFQSTPRQ